MKKFFLLLLCCIFLLAGCSKNRDFPEIATEKTVATIDESLENYIDEYQKKQQDEKFPTTPTLYIKNKDEIVKKEITNFENKNYNEIIGEILKELNTNINFNVLTTTDAIVVSFTMTPPENEEIYLLESIATTLHKNYKKEIIFRINDKEYNSNNFFFGYDETFPTNPDII